MSCTHSVNEPTMIGSFADACFSRHAKAFSLMQLHTDSSGVGGSVLLASKVSFSAGHPMVLAAGAADCVGVFGGVVELYSAARRVKSSDVCTLLPSALIVVMP